MISQVLGARLAADTGEWGTFSWSQFVLGVPGMRIAGGTDEVMRNIVGERVLGLPKEPGIDTTSPKVPSRSAPTRRTECTHQTRRTPALDLYTARSGIAGGRRRGAWECPTTVCGP